METIILPGFSQRNKAWAEEVWAKLNPLFPTTVINWAHWETGRADRDWVEKEVKKIVDLLGDKQVNIIAKSIGTLVTMKIIKLKPESVNKIILCGVPIQDFAEGDEKYYDVLKVFPESKILCIQNADDNHGSYAEIVNFLHSINPRLRIVSKPRSDHEYPYTEDFVNFLK